MPYYVSSPFPAGSRTKRQIIPLPYSGERLGIAHASIYSLSYINCAGPNRPDNHAEISLELEKIVVGNFVVGLGKDTSRYLRNISDERLA